MEGFILIIVLWVVYDFFIGKPAQEAQRKLERAEMDKKREETRIRNEQFEISEKNRKDLDYMFTKLGNETREEFDARKYEEARQEALNKLYSNPKFIETQRLIAEGEAEELEDNYNDYKAYIKSSPIWQAKRQERLEIDDHECQACGTSNRLQVHHVEYDTLFDEGMEDLVTVCKSCHDKIHAIAGKNARYYPVHYAY